MKKIVVFFIMLSYSLFGQQENKGDRLRSEGRLDEAIKAYKEIYQKNPNNQDNTYNLACAYAIQYKKDSAFHYLNVALNKDNSLWALADNDLYALTSDKRWNMIERQQLEKYQKQNGNVQKPKYVLKLLRLIMKDQALDYQLDMAKQYFMRNGKAPHWYYPIAQMKKEIGNGNFNKMEKLILENGWPTYSSVGKLAADSPLLIINHHQDEAVRIKYLPLIKKACINKEGSCLEYAKIQDRILVNTGKKQLFGMQFRYNDKRKLEPFPIENPEYVDKRRKEIGLEPLKEYLKRKINYAWSVEQK
ncbi:DUF6624 domain-containing protein [Tenacibaculum singaporense]|uniref:DUF6624 domain-containing protein n=1 Tax=Tenacibaculum singaporense TaxID=2358479 RepID=UPI000F68B1D0|nr:DUF6624 domain-containing protein [Tenacibaculum singaporense]RSC92106.1 hypothetical protein EI424_15100 [Tenacibaculum singaporense]